MAAQAVITGKQGLTKRRERLFYTGMSVAIVLTVFAGFARTYYLRPYYESQPLVPLLRIHGFIFTAWIGLYIAQTTLIAAKRTRTHRQLGIVGGVIAALLVVVGTFTTIARVKHFDVPPGVNPLTFLPIGLVDMLLFGLLVGAAFYYRRRIETHKRLMLLATISILSAAVSRWPIKFIEEASFYTVFALSDLFIIPCLIYDIVTRGRPHRATVIGGALIAVSHPLRLLLGNTHAWLVFATWLTQWT